MNEELKVDKVNQVMDIVKSMGIDELINLNKYIVGFIRAKSNQGNEEYAVGDKVFFKGRRGVEHGIITKLNRTRAIVKTECRGNQFVPVQHVNWNVPYAMLSKEQ
jgi:hypothetical protein